MNIQALEQLAAKCKPDEICVPGPGEIPGGPTFDAIRAMVEKTLYAGGHVDPAAIAETILSLRPEKLIGSPWS